MPNGFGPGKFDASNASPTRPAFTPTGTAAAPRDYFKDCSNPALEDGTSISAAWLNLMKAQVEELAASSGVTEDGSDFMTVRAVRSQRANFASAAAVTGSANAIALAFSPAFTALADLVGVPIRFIAEANVTSQPTIAVDALAATATVGPWWSVGDLVQVIYDGTVFRVTVFGALPPLPIFPETLTADGRLTMSHSAGSLVVTGATLRFRGWQDVDLAALTLPQRTFATIASRTYHLRFDRVNGLRLLDLSSGVYNPGALGENNGAFDSTFDDVLLARVVTNGSNVGAVTTLANRPFGRLSALSSVNSTTAWAISGAQRVTYEASVSLNWARAPATYINTCAVTWETGGTQATMSGGGTREDVRTLDRYGLLWRGSTDWNDGNTGISSLADTTRCSGTITLMA